MIRRCHGQPWTFAECVDNGFSRPDVIFLGRDGFGQDEWDYTAGDELDLRYNPADPQEIYLDHVQSVWQQYASPFFIIIGGLIFIAAYYFIL